MATETEDNNNMIPSPPSIPTDPAEHATSPKKPDQEPPRKRMKVDAPQIPHYNSHNIYSRPPVPPSSMPIPSLPVIVPPVTPLDDADTAETNGNHNTSETAANGGCTVAALSAESEQWPLCAYCGQTGELSRCSSCRQAYYCNRDCQVSHWEVHCIVCQPGPPQPADLPKQGQPIQPPTVFTPAVYPQPPQYQQQAAYGGHQPQSMPHNAAANGYGTQPHQSRPKPARRQRSSSNYYPADNDGNKEQYYCEECDRYFKNGQALGGHRSRVHSSRRNGGDQGMDRPGIPPQSGHTASRRRRPRASRGRHEATANGQYVCPHCGREFATGNALGGHISGAHTKKSKRMQQEQQSGHVAYNGYARPRHPNL